MQRWKRQYVANLLAKGFDSFLKILGGMIYIQHFES